MRGFPRQTARGLISQIARVDARALISIANSNLASKLHEANEKLKEVGLETFTGTSHCKRCNRLLKDKVSQSRGFGRTCYKKYVDSITPMEKQTEFKNEKILASRQA